ncbi:hypothetical protein [Flavobacterium procerum]|uniref:hypothetical protein n=1 Tax=Flavobacterium procerum TaxID=1455569 RepID=UPI0036D43AE8
MRKSFDVFLKNETVVNSLEKVGSETEFGKEVARIMNEYGDNQNVKNLDFQYKKIILIANDIRYLKLIHDETLPDWLEDELETVFHKIKKILLVLEIELN